MRILHLYAGNLYGGIERLLATYAEQREQCPELVPYFGLCFEGRLAKELRAAGVEVYILGEVRLSRPWTTWRARRRLNRLLAGPVQFDAILTHASWPHAVFASTIARRKLPLIFVAHDAYRELTAVDRAAARIKPDRIIANSAYTASTIATLFPNSRCDVRHLPVPAPPMMDRMATRREIRAALDSRIDRIVIICSARMEHWKGQTLLLQALADLKGDQWECWIVGGAQRSEEQHYVNGLNRQADDAGIRARVKFLGQRNDVPLLLAAADIYCQPNIGPEPFGIAFIEALYAGLPVVTTRLGAPAEFIDETCGKLTPPGDCVAVASILQQLIDDGWVRQLLSAGGPQRAGALCDVPRQLDVEHKLILAAVDARRNTT